MSNSARSRIVACVYLAAAALFRFTRVLAPIVAAGLVLGFSAACPDGDGHRTGPGGLLLIDSVAPSVGLTIGTTVVIISGQGFKAGATVTFGGVPANVSQVTETRITAVAPAHGAQTVDVSVTNPDGVTLTGSNLFTYVFVPPPAISSITPNIGSTGGGATIGIEGTGFLLGMTATLDGATVISFLNSSRTRLTVITGPHVTGSVDVVLRNADGQSGSVPGGFTFMPPESFDSNGKWFAFLGNGNDDPFSFRITSGALVSVTCDDGTTVTLATPVPLVRGEVTATGPTGVIFSARLVAPNSAVGTIKIGSCSSTNWTGWKDLLEGSAAAQSAARGRR
jgi:IPT/TIG domain